MLALIAMLLIPLTFLLGTGVTHILYGKGRSVTIFWEDQFLAGILTLIGLAECAHLGALARGQSILVFQKYFCILLGATLLLGAVILGILGLLRKKSGRATPEKASRTKGEVFGVKEKVMLGAFLVIAVSQLCLILFRNAIYLEGDLTLETVYSFLQTGKLYEINPLTGMPYEMGLPLRLKILCLPTAFAALSALPGMDPQQVTWHFIPALTLAFAYLAYFSLARALFPEKREHRILFLLIVSILFFVGDYAYGMEAFGIFHVGAQGTAIRGAVLMPYLFGLCLRRKWKLAILVAAAESCITWTLYGMGMAVFMILAFLAMLGVGKLIRKEGTK